MSEIKTFAEHRVDLIAQHAVAEQRELHLRGRARCG
jgi:hypothetical protein